MVKSLLMPILFGGRAQSAMRCRYLAVLLLLGRCTCALLPAAQKGKGFDVVRYRRGAGSTLAVLRFSCLPNSAGSGCWLCVGAAESTISLLRSHRPPSGARNAAPKGRGRAQASGVWQGRAPATKAAASIVQPRRERPAHGRSDVHPATRANSPPVRQEGGLDVRPHRGRKLSGAA